MRALPAWALLFAALSAQAEQPGLRPAVTGSWVLSAATQRATLPVCRGMRMTFTSDGHLLRQTGKLKYRTTVKLAPEGNGWLLTESVVSQNGQKSCGGQPADTVLRQLGFHQAYIEVGDLWLRYYRDKADRKPMEFVRVPRPSPPRKAR